MNISRRSFLKTCSATAAAAGLPLWFVEQEMSAAGAASRPLSPNDRPGIGLVGCGGRGRYDASNASRFGEVLAVCDVDAQHAEAAVRQFTVGHKVPTKYHDFRKLLERDDIHVLITTTPDHWHTLVNLAAAAAGKDIYSEKPLTLSIDEGKRLVHAVRQRRNIFQTGSQQRSDRRFRLACELVRNGRLGQLKEVQVWLPAGLRGGPFSPKPVPKELDWNFWLGQAPKVDYMPQRCHVFFRYWFDYSGGTMTDWGAHHNDIALWGIGLPGPVRIEGKPLTKPVPGGYTAFSQYEVKYTYSNGVIHRVHSTPADNIYGGVADPKGQRNGIRFEGPEGWIWVNRAGISASDPALLTTPLPAGAVRLYVSNDHMGNFFDCIRSRKSTICPASVGHRAASVCHLGNIALRTGLDLGWDPVAQDFTGQSAYEAAPWLARKMRAPYDYRFI